MKCVCDKIRMDKVIEQCMRDRRLVVERKLGSWCAHWDDFEDFGKSEYAFGPTPSEALALFTGEIQYQGRMFESKKEGE